MRRPIISEILAANVYDDEAMPLHDCIPGKRRMDGGLVCAICHRSYREKSVLTGGGTVMVTPTTACKHGDQDCERCGTTSRRDALHATIKGKGRVGSIPPRKP